MPERKERTGSDAEKYDPSEIKGLSDRPYGREEYSPEVLFTFVWSRMPNITKKQKRLLANIISQPELHAQRAMIVSAIKVEESGKLEDKNRAIVLLENFLQQLEAIGEASPQIGEDEILDE